MPPLNPPSQPSHILTNLPHCIVTLSWLPLLHLMHTLQGVYWKLCRAKSKWLPQRKGKWQRMSRGGATERGREREGGGRVHKRQVLCALSIFGCAPEQVVVVLAASMLTQCSARPTVYCQQPFATPPPTLFSPSSSLLSSACCTFWLCSGAQLK